MVIPNWFYFPYLATSPDSERRGCGIPPADGAPPAQRAGVLSQSECEPLVGNRQGLERVPRGTEPPSRDRTFQGLPLTPLYRSARFPAGVRRPPPAVGVPTEGGGSWP